MTEDRIVEFLPKLTSNGAHSLRNTLIFPNECRPNSEWHPVNIHTGLGKYTHLALLGVSKSLEKLGMAEDRIWIEPGSASWERGTKWFVLTERGLRVAEYLVEHWNEVTRTVDFRDFCGRR